MEVYSVPSANPSQGLNTEYYFVQLLENLPQTVRGVGRELYGSHEPTEPVLSHSYGDLTQQRKHDRLSSLVGFIVVVSPFAHPFGEETVMRMSELFRRDLVRRSGTRISIA